MIYNPKFTVHIQHTYDIRQLNLLELGSSHKMVPYYWHLQLLAVIHTWSTIQNLRYTTTYNIRQLNLLDIWKLGEPKEEIGNLNGFEYMYLSNLKVPYFLYLSSVSIKVISMGTTLFPSMARLALPWMNKQKMDPEKLHLQLTRMSGGEKRIRDKKWKPQYNSC